MASTTVVLDGHQRSALAATRSIGRLGPRVIVAEREQPCLAASSRYCAGTLVYPDPRTRPDAFRNWLIALDRVHPGAVLMPMTDLTVPAVLDVRPRLQTLRTVLPEASAYEAVSDKLELFRLASAAGIPTPRTALISRGAAESPFKAFTLPAVVKARRSVTAGMTVRTPPVRYAHSADELRTIAASTETGELELLAQEYVSGTGAGLFALYDRGKPVQFFAHRRIREKPPTGGISVLSESVATPESMVQTARKLLDPLRWHGVAMLEFKVDGQGTPWLIEINARFWGSLQLAVDAGADFPRLLYSLAVGNPVPEDASYELGRKLRWLLGDLDSLFITLKHRDLSPTVLSKLGAVAQFMVPWQRGLRYELLRWSDPRPAGFALRDYLAAHLWHSGKRT